MACEEKSFKIIFFVLLFWRIIHQQNKKKTIIHALSPVNRKPLILKNNTRHSKCNYKLIYDTITWGIFIVEA